MERQRIADVKAQERYIQTLEEQEQEKERQWKARHDRVEANMNMMAKTVLKD